MILGTLKHFSNPICNKIILGTLIITTPFQQPSLNQQQPLNDNISATQAVTRAL
jgi:hypothetical protein